MRPNNTSAALGQHLLPLPIRQAWRQTTVRGVWNNVGPRKSTLRLSGVGDDPSHGCVRTMRHVDHRGPRDAAASRGQLQRRTRQHPVQGVYQHLAADAAAAPSVGRRQAEPTGPPGSACASGCGRRVSWRANRTAGIGERRRPARTRLHGHPVLEDHTRRSSPHRRESPFHNHSG